MKNFILIPFFLLSFIVKSQTLIEYDRMETSSTGYLTAGWWVGSTSGWFTNASVSPTVGAAFYGVSTSPVNFTEEDWYVLPNVTGLNPSRQYQLKFRLASYSFTSSSAGTRGVDSEDFVEVQVSTNGGINYTQELRIRGFSNARWPFTSTGVINHTANGSFTNSNAPAGDVYIAPAGQTTTGPSTVYLNLPTGISQVAIDIYLRANASGEEWWIDDIELWDITPIALPVELVSFDGNPSENGNHVIWKTSSENNSDYFLIESSTNGEDYITLKKIYGAGYSTEMLEYSIIDNRYTSEVTYYRLIQYDYNGESKIYGPISVVNNVKTKNLIKVTNLIGQEIDENYNGVIIEIYDDGSTIKKMR